MKKFLTVLLSLCLLVSVVSAFAVNAFAAEDIQVTVGQKFEWNDQSADADTQKTWRTGKGKSPDGLWKYQIYVLAKDMYLDATLASGPMYAWNATPGDKGLGYARARQFGKNFHPGEAGDIVKVFTFPSGGTVTVDTNIFRDNEWVTGTGTPTSIAFYLEDKLVYPTASEYESITSATPRDISFDLEVAKNQRLYIRIGCVEGDQGGDAVNMSNSVTYKAVNDSIAEIEEVTSTSTREVPTASSIGWGTGEKTTDNSGTSSVKLPTGGNDDSSSTGLIIGVVAAVVVVAAVAVVIVVKKKKQD